jgi:hypothetical protein
MKALKLTPGGMLPLASDDRPVPSTSRNSSGWISDVTARSRSRRNLMSSRRHTMLTARRSDRRVCWGTETLIRPARAAASALATAASVSVDRVVAIGHRLPRKWATIWRIASAPVPSASRMVLPV